MLLRNLLPSFKQQHQLPIIWQLTHTHTHINRHIHPQIHREGLLSQDLQWVHSTDSSAGNSVWYRVLSQVCTAYLSKADVAWCMFFTLYHVSLINLGALKRVCTRSCKKQVSQKGRQRDFAAVSSHFLEACIHQSLLQTPQHLKTPHTHRPVHVSVDNITPKNHT